MGVLNGVGIIVGGLKKGLVWGLRRGLCWGLYGGFVWGFQIGFLNVLYCMVCGSCMAIRRGFYMVIQMGF